MLTIFKIEIILEYDQNEDMFYRTSGDRKYKQIKPEDCLLFRKLLSNAGLIIGGNASEEFARKLQHAIVENFDSPSTVARLFKVANAEYNLKGN